MRPVAYRNSVGRCSAVSTLGKKREDSEMADEKPMAQYAGYFEFQNQFEQPIVGGYARHSTTDWGTETLTFDAIPVGEETLTIPFKTSSSNKDRWAFSVKLADGNYCGVSEKICGFEQDDNGKVVTLQPVRVKDKKPGTFNIIMPETSSCSCDIEYPLPGETPDITGKS